jgi:ribosome-associated protein
VKESVRVNKRLTIPGSEIDLTFSPSGGPGGQHANRSSTRAELAWNVAASEVLGPRQRARIMERLGRRIDANGVLRLTSDAHRSQLRNRKDVLDRLGRLVADALRPIRSRVPTAPTKAAKERRLQEKRRRSEVKRLRGRPTSE